MGKDQDNEPMQQGNNDCYRVVKIWACASSLILSQGPLFHETSPISDWNHFPGQPLCSPHRSVRIKWWAKESCSTFTLTLFPYKTGENPEGIWPPTIWQPVGTQRIFAEQWRRASHLPGTILQGLISSICDIIPISQRRKLRGSGRLTICLKSHS